MTTKSSLPYYFIACISIISVHALKGHDRLNGSRISGGEIALPDQFPYMVAIFEGDAYWCGGTIVSDEYVLVNRYIFAEADKIKVVAGNIKATLDAPSVVKGVSEIHKYGAGKEDIALLKVNSKFSFDKAVNSIGLDEKNSVTGQCITSGWGYTGENINIGENLRFVQLQVLNQEECSNSIGTEVTDSQLCAGKSEDGASLCALDHGNPLVCDGVISGVAAYNVDCDTATTNVYGRISFYRDWIRDTMTDASSRLINTLNVKFLLLTVGLTTILSAINY